MFPKIKAFVAKHFCVLQQFPEILVDFSPPSIHSYLGKHAFIRET